MATIECMWFSHTKFLPLLPSIIRICSAHIYIFFFFIYILSFLLYFGLVYAIPFIHSSAFTFLSFVRNMGFGHIFFHSVYSSLWMVRLSFRFPPFILYQVEKLVQFSQIWWARNFSTTILLPIFYFLVLLHLISFVVADEKEFQFQNSCFRHMKKIVFVHKLQ